MLDFPGIGRVIEKVLEQSDYGPDAQEPKQLDTPAALQLAGEIDALSTGRDLSGRCLSDATHVDPGTVTADDAQLICKSVLSELLNPSASRAPASSIEVPFVAATPRESTMTTPRDANKGFDLASVKVVACDRGCISGKLDWLGQDNVSKMQEKVAFTLLEIRQGYTVVGETVEGPKLLSSLCWKLQSINGSAECRPAWIRRGDVLILEGPKWATKRLRQPLPTRAPVTLSTPRKKPSADSEIHLPAEVPATSSRSASAAPLPDDSDDAPPPLLLSTSTPPQIGKPSCSSRTSPKAALASPVAHRELSSPVYSSLSRSIDFEVVHVSTIPSSPGTTSVPSRSATEGREPTEVSSASGSQADRSHIPVLDLNAVSRRREKLALVTQPSNGVESKNGCLFGYAECSMLPPMPPVMGSRGKKEKDGGWQCV